LDPHITFAAKQNAVKIERFGCHISIDMFFSSENSTMNSCDLLKSIYITGLVCARGLACGSEKKPLG
jgi:hypothetical protein